MTRIFAVTVAEHLQFTPDPVNVSTAKKEATQEQAPVDQWRTVTVPVAVVDGFAEEAIDKAKSLLVKRELDTNPGTVSERRVLAVALQHEAE